MVISLQCKTLRELGFCQITWRFITAYRLEKNENQNPNTESDISIDFDVQGIKLKIPLTSDSIVNRNCFSPNQAKTNTLPCWSLLQTCYGMKLEILAPARQVWNTNWGKSIRFTWFNTKSRCHSYINRERGRSEPQDLHFRGSSVAFKLNASERHHDAPVYRGGATWRTTN